MPLPPSSQVVDPAHALFSHQRVAAERLMQSLEEEPNRVLLHMPYRVRKDSDRYACDRSFDQ